MIHGAFCERFNVLCTTQFRDVYTVTRYCKYFFVSLFSGMTHFTMRFMVKWNFSPMEYISVAKFSICQFTYQFCLLYELGACHITFLCKARAFG